MRIRPAPRVDHAERGLRFQRVNELLRRRIRAGVHHCEPNSAGSAILPVEAEDLAEDIDQRDRDEEREAESRAVAQEIRDVFAEENENRAHCWFVILSGRSLAGPWPRSPARKRKDEARRPSLRSRAGLHRKARSKTAPLQ